MKILLDYFELKKIVKKMFDEAGIDEMSDFDWICCEVTGKKRSELPLIGKFSGLDTVKIFEAVNQRIKHIPFGYIFGRTEFFGYKLKVNKNVLIPRLDTEILIEQVIDEIKKSIKIPSVLDIGTGSGAIAIVIQKETGVKVTACDISKEALEVAKENARINEAEVEFVHSDLFDNLANKKYDIIVSNPPYIESKVIDSLDEEVKNFEPHLALDGGKDGLDYYKKIIDASPKYLENGGKLFFEIGYNQAESVSKLMQKDFKNIKVYKDYSGNDRVVCGEFYD